MIGSRLMQGLGILMVSVLLLVACGTLAAGTPEEPEGTIMTKSVQVVPGTHVTFEGQSSLPDGKRLQTQLSADEAPVTWWPAEATAEVEAGQWQIRVPLGEEDAPQTLSEDELYVLHVWEQGNRAIKAQPFVFDVSGPPAPGTGEPSGDVIHGTAHVEEVDLLIMESFPVQVAAVARGYLPDGCTAIDQVRSSFDADSNTFSVTISTVRDKDAMCTQATVPFEERVELDVYGLPAGTYTVDVSGVQKTFTFDVDNKPAESSSSEVPWDEARALILAGEVEQVTQLHSLQVTLKTKDGRRLVTFEPHIDDVFDVVDKCGEPCAEMILATE